MTQCRPNRRMIASLRGGLVGSTRLVFSPEMSMNGAVNAVGQLTGLVGTQSNSPHIS